MKAEYWVFVSFVCPIVAFGLYAFARTTAPADTEGKEFLDDFLVTSHSSRSSDVGASTVAYMLQMSTTFYFVFWGFRYGLSNVAYVITWALGIALFSMFARRLLEVRENFETLGHFLSSKGGVALRVAVGSVLTLFFLGLVYVETFFAADFLSALFSTTDGSVKTTLWWTFFLILLFSVASYSYIGGMRKVIATDRIQLSIAYVGFAAVFAHLIPEAINRNLSTGLLVWALTFAVYGAIHWRLRAEQPGLWVTWALRLSLVMLILSLVVAKPWESNHSLIEPLAIAGPLKQVAEPWGWVTLVGFTVANLLWQFGDSSNFQRIACLDLGSAKHADEKVRRIQLLLRPVAIVAPLTWGFGIVLGMLLAANGTIQPNEGEEYASFLSGIADGVVAGDLRATGVAIALGLSISVVMLSTADSSLLAYLQATIQDVSRAKHGSNALVVAYGAAAAIAIIGIAIAHKHFGQAHVFTVLGMFNALVLLLAVPSLLALLHRPLSPTGLWLTLAIGGALVVLATFGPVDALPFNIKVVLPFFGALVGALIGWILSQLLP